MKLRSLSQNYKATFSFGIGIVFLIALCVFAWWSFRSEARLPRLLVRLPDSVVAVRLESLGTESDVVMVMIERLLPTDVPALPDSVQPRATLYVKDAEELKPVALVFRNDAEVSMGGTLWQGYYLFGPPEAVEQIVSAELKSLLTAQREVISFLTAGFPHKFLFRRDFLARLHPLLSDLEGTGWDAVAWSASSQYVAFQAHHGSGGSWAKNVQPYLPPVLPTPFVVVDSLPANFLFPADLPPVLQALREATGVSEELLDLQGFLVDHPLSLAFVEWKGQAVPLIVVAITPNERDAAHSALAALFNRRLQELHAIPEKIEGPRGTVIRHRRPLSGDSLLVSESRGGVEILRAPCGMLKSLQDLTSDSIKQYCLDAVSDVESSERETDVQPYPVRDLVAIIGEKFLILGTDGDLVEHTHAILQDTSWIKQQVAGTRIFIDAERLQHVPLVSTLVNSLPSQTQARFSTLRAVNVTITPAQSGVNIAGSITLFPGTLGR